MKKTKENYALIFYLIVTFVVVVITVLFSSFSYDAKDYVDLNEGWYVEIEDQVYENVSLGDFTFKPVNRGEKIVLSYEIMPEDLVDNPMLEFYSCHSTVDVYLGGKVVYRYGQSLYAQNKLLGYGYHYVGIGDDFNGGTVEITLYASEDAAYTSVKIPRICNGEQVLRDFLISNRVPFAVNVFLVILGLILVFLSIFFSFYNKQFLKLFCIGGFSTCIGLWSICNYDLIAVFTYNMRAKPFLEYGTLYLAPFFVVLYFLKDTFFTRSKITTWIYRVLLFGQAGFAVVAFVLQAFNLVHFPQVLFIEHIIIYCFAAAFVSIVIYDLVHKRMQNKVLVMGMTVMVVIAFIDVVWFNIRRYFLATGSTNYAGNICTGALLLVFAQVIEFFIEISDMLQQSAEAKLLEQIAYVDSLTGIANRRQCEVVWDELDKKTPNYGIFSFDLNDLKNTNDTKGHIAGDELLKTFAEVLSVTFSQVGTVGRIGGDEFVVIIPDLTEVDVDALINQYESEMEKVNKEKPELSLKAAYGFCSYEQCHECDSRKIYKIADERMYEKKSSMKKG